MAFGTLPESPGRIMWIDTAKGIGIILVVIGHICLRAVDGGLSWFIFLFHMPLFFILSGMLIKAEPVGISLRKKTWSLLVPYVTFLVLFGSLMVGKDVLRHLSPAADLFDLVYGGDRLSGYLGVSWFITCLFFSQITFNVLLSRGRAPFSAGMLIAIAISLAGAYLLVGFTGPLAIGIVPFAVVMLWVGYACRTTLARSGLPGAVGLVVAASLLSSSSGFGMDMKHAVYGPPIVGAMLAIALAFVVIEISKWVDRVPRLGRLSRAFGRGSMMIMFLHQPIHFALRDSIPSDPVLALVAVTISMLAYAVVKRARLPSMILLGHSLARRSPLTQG
jgi:fucose 4-O-acetylase-like acetyltransferase